MFPQDGRSKLSPIRSGTEPCTTAVDFDEESPDVALCENDGDIVSSKCHGRDGQGGCLDMTRPDNHVDSYSALAFYDMLDVEWPNTWGSGTERVAP